jgi:hypothetical protein
MVIYKTTNLVNGKQYIGRDSHNNPNYLGSGPLLKKAIKKYGKENFKKEVIEECSSLEQLVEREEYWLNFYNAGDNPLFYNLQNCGKGASLKGENNPAYGKGHLFSGERNHFYGKNHSDCTKEKIRQYRLGRKLDESTKQKLRERFQGENGPMYSKRHSDATRKKISDRLFGKFEGEKNPMYGKRHSQETKEKISNMRVGRFFGEDNPFYGKTHSEETKRKISESRTKRSVICIEGQYKGEVKTRIEWAGILNMCHRNFSKHLAGKQYKNGIKGNFFKWEDEI